LGVTGAYLRMVRSGKARAGDGLLCQALKYVTEDELRLLLKGAVPEARASLNDAVRVIATARVDPEFREFLLGLLRILRSRLCPSLQPPIPTMSTRRSSSSLVEVV